MSIGGGVAFIARQQRADGGFWEYCLDESDAETKRRYRTTFTPSLVALALARVPGARTIGVKATGFLLAQKSQAWTWNYWAKSSALRKTQPYPDDLDDTFLALSALWTYDQSLLTPSASAAIAHILFAAEVTPGGPYRTWLVDTAADEVWRDTDLAVNGNIGAFLALQGIELPGLNEFVKQAVDTGSVSSPYYPGALPLMYYLSSWYRQESKHMQRIVLADQKDGRWRTPHQTALAVTTLLRLGYPPAKLKTAVHYLKTMQAADGGWPSGSMCIGPGKQPSGARSLTTALCLEALVLYKQLGRTQRIRPLPVKIDDDHKAVTGLVESRISQLDEPELREQTHEVLQRITRRDGERQVVGLSSIVARALRLDVDKQVIHQLAAANVWGWMAYTVFDDFLDNEGQPKWLPSAVFAQRQLMRTLDGLWPDQASFHTMVESIMSQIDGANAWEVCNCRGTFVDGRLVIRQLPDYRDYGQLAARSLGHTIPALGVLYAAGISVESPIGQALTSFFTQYLISRQLNDDAHDWEDDLALGHVNAVAVEIIDRWTKKEGNTLAAGIDIEQHISALRLIMWEQVIDEISVVIRRHLDEARRVLLQPELQGTLDSEVLLALLEPVENATRNALRTRDEALEFITAL